NELFGLVAEEAFEHLHEDVDFVLGTTPVFDGKRVERDVANAEIAGDADDFFHGIGTFAVAFDAGQSAFARPASIAIHNDGDVLRNGSWLAVHKLREIPFKRKSENNQRRLRKTRARTCGFGGGWER